MDRSSTVYVGLDVDKDSIDIATADPGREGEIRHVGNRRTSITGGNHWLRRVPLSATGQIDRSEFAEGWARPLDRKKHYQRSPSAAGAGLPATAAARQG